MPFARSSGLVALLSAVLISQSAGAAPGEPGTGAAAARQRHAGKIVGATLSAAQAMRGSVVDLRATPLPRRLRNLEGSAPARVKAITGRTQAHRIARVKVEATGTAADHLPGQMIVLDTTDQRVTFNSVYADGLALHRVDTADPQRLTSYETQVERVGQTPTVRRVEGRTERNAGLPVSSQKNAQLGAELPVGVSRLPSGLAVPRGSWIVESVTTRAAKPAYMLYSWQGEGNAPRRVGVQLVHPQDMAFAKSFVARPGQVE